MENWHEDWTAFVSLQDLKRELTPEMYFAELVAESAPDPDPERTLTQQRQLEELTQPGDVWWEWVQGKPGGVPLLQCGGLALVRDGKIVWAGQTWIS